MRPASRVVCTAYRRLAQKYHPDLAAEPEASARMVAINAAWAVLRDPESRGRLMTGRARPPPGGRARGRRRGRASSPEPPASDPPRASTGGDSGAGPKPPGRPESGSADWSPGRSTIGSGYDPATMRTREGFGAAGAPPGNPSGSVMNFGRYAAAGRSARSPGATSEYLEWLDRMPIGRTYRTEIDVLLRAAGRRRAAQPDAPGRRGLFRRR